MQLGGTRVMVLGMARSGVAAARLALAAGASVRCVDRREDAPRVEGAECSYGPHDPAWFTDPALRPDLIVVSPGIPARLPLLQAAAEVGVEIVGELGFAARFLEGVPIFAISGTNGKSTATYLLSQLLQQGGLRTFIGGNFGVPLSEAALAALSGERWGALAVEVSSYQMELPGGFHPRAAAILNLTPDHLERHGTMESYGAHKCRMFAQMTAEDLRLLPHDDPWIPALAAASPGTLGWIGGAPGVEIVYGASGAAEGLQITMGPDPGWLSLADFRLPGPHNLQNLAAAVMLTLWAGVPRAALRLGALVGLEHRLEEIAQPGGVRWINDSKATNVDAVRVALGAVAGPGVLILGGRGKAGAPYAALRPLLQGWAVVCQGEAGPEIAAALAGIEGPLWTVAGLREAVALARQQAQPGQVVLLSPACASFDAFTDFEHRGRVFRALVRGEEG